MPTTRPPVILLAEDDVDDRELVEDALADIASPAELRCVADGEELLEYLGCRGHHGPPADAPRPTLILLDLKLPKKNGWEALAEIRQDATLRAIPVVVFSTSNAQADVRRSYELGACSYLVKPVTFEALTAALAELQRYWLELVQLPDTREEA